MSKKLLIREFCETSAGSTPSRKELDKYYGGSIAWVKSGELRANTILDTEEKITEAALKGSRLKVVQPGALLMAMYGANVGKLATLGIPATTNQAVCAIKPDASVAHSRYLYHYLGNKSSELIRMAVGGAQPNISKEIINNIEVPLPPLAEQKRIAEILDKADRLRQLRRQAIQKLDELLQSVFVEMFGDPVKNEKKFPTSRMGDLVEFTGGSQPPKSTFEYEPRPGYVRLVQIRDFKSDRYLTYIPEARASRRFVETDILIGRYGPPIFQILRGLSGSYNVALMKASPKEGIDNEYLFHMLRQPSIFEAVNKNSQRTAGQTGVNLDYLENLSICKPPLKLQLKFAEFAKVYDSEKSLLQKSAVGGDHLCASLQSSFFA